MPRGSLADSFAATSLLPAIPSASTTGIAQGLRNASIKSLNVFEKSKEAQNLLESVQKSIQEFNSQFADIQQEFSGLDAFKGSLGDFFGSVDFTRQKMALIPEAASQTAGVLVSHGLQSGTDTTIGVHAGLSEGVKLPEYKDWSKASELKENARDNFFASCQHFQKEFNRAYDRIGVKVADAFIDRNASAMTMHRSAAAGTAFGVFATATTPTAVATCLWDTLGAFLRNLQASLLDTQHSRADEDKLLKAVQACLHSMEGQVASKDACFNSLEKLNRVALALIETDAVQQQTSDRAATGTRPFSKTASTVSAPLVMTLQLVLDSGLAFMLASEALDRRLNVPSPKDLSHRASSLEQKDQNSESNSHSKNISSLAQQFSLMSGAINQIIAEDKHVKNGADVSNMISFGNTSLLSASASSLLPLLVLELGSITRELAAGLQFTTHGQGNRLLEQSKVTSQSNAQVGEELDTLFIEALKTRDALDMAKDLGASSPFFLGLSRAGLSGSVVGTLNVLLGALSAVKEVHTAMATVSQSPQHSQLNAEEKEKVQQSVRETKESNKSASSVLVTSEPKALTAEKALESILNKVILLKRGSEYKGLAERKDLNSVGRASVGAENASSTAITRSGEFSTGSLAAVAWVFLESGVTVEALVRALSNVLESSLVSVKDSRLFTGVAKDLTARHEVKDDKSASRAKTLASERQEVFSGLEGAMVDAVQQAEGKEPGQLHKAAASQSATSTQTGILSVSMAEATVIEPSVVGTELTQKARQHDHRHDQEAVVDSVPSKQLSVFSNQIRQFLFETIREAQDEKRAGQNQSLLDSHGSTRSTEKTAVSVSAAMSVVLLDAVEMIVSRSLTLLDSDKIGKKSAETVQLTKENLKENLSLATAEMKADSRLGSSVPSMNQTAALRSTLTHISEAFKACADELAKEVNATASDIFVKDNAILSSQGSMMQCMATALTHTASLLTRLAASGTGLSFSHIILLGQVDNVRRRVHSSDESLELQQRDSSQKSTKRESTDTSLVTGLSADMLTSAIFNVTRILLRATIVGTDSVLSVSKLLEILLLDINPAERLRIEFEQLSLPQVGTAGVSASTRQSLLVSELLPLVTTAQTSVTRDDEVLRSTLNSSFNSLQKKVNELIGQLDVLEDTEVYSEQSPGEIKGLKGYVHALIKALYPTLSEGETRRLVERFNKGGQLSHYHQAFGGLLYIPTEEARGRNDAEGLVNRISSVDALIDQFVQTMTEDYSRFMKQEGIQSPDPLKAFNSTLGQRLTDKAQALHHHVITRIAVKLYEANNIARSRLSGGPVYVFNKERTIAIYTRLGAVEQKQGAAASAEGESEIERQIKEIEERSKKRELKREQAKKPHWSSHIGQGLMQDSSAEAARQQSPRESSPDASEFLTQSLVARGNQQRPVQNYGSLNQDDDAPTESQFLRPRK